MTLCTLTDYSWLTALLSAGFWFASAVTKVPIPQWGTTPLAPEMKKTLQDNTDRKWKRVMLLNGIAAALTGVTALLDLAGKHYWRDRSHAAMPRLAPKRRSSSGMVGWTEVLIS
jgi:hypothetical protein